ncbi:MAG: hypothetical protein WB975_11090, partial [Nitrososphaeraceae archaeon]
MLNKWPCFSIAFFLFLIAILSTSSAFAQNTTLPYSLSESSSQAKSLSGYANKTAETAGTIANKTAETAGTIANKTAETAGTIANKTAETAGTIANKTAETA